MTLTTSKMAGTCHKYDIGQWSSITTGLEKARYLGIIYRENFWRSEVFGERIWAKILRNTWSIKWEILDFQERRNWYMSWPMYSSGPCIVANQILQLPTSVTQKLLEIQLWKFAVTWNVLIWFFRSIFVPLQQIIMI